MGQARADYLSKSGVDAVNALPEYQKQIQAIHAGAVNSASNPMLKVMVGRELTNRVSRDLDFAGLHASTELKRSAVQTSEATVKSIGDEALAAPYNQQDFAKQLDKTEAEIRGQQTIQGWTQPIVDQKVQEARSNLAAKQILGMARLQPYAANKAMQDAISSGDLRGEVIAHVQKVVQDGMHTVGARNISHQVNSGQDLYYGSKVVTANQAKEAIGTFESGNNYDNTGVMTKHGRALGKYQVMEEYLPDYLKRAGLPPMSAQEFLKNHDAQEKVFEGTFIKDMQQYGSFNEAASRWFTGKGVAEGAKAPPDALGTTQPAYLRQTNAILARSAPLADKVARGTQIASAQSPDDPLLQDYTQQRIESDFSRDRRITLNDEYNNRQNIEQALMGDAQTGKLPTTVEELKNSSPQAEASWNALPPAKQRSYIKALTQNAKGDFGWTEPGLRQYGKLKGMAQVDPADFLQMDIPSEKLPWSARRELINLQWKLKEKAEGDPHVTKFMSDISGDLFNAGITKTADPDGYYQFAGAAQDALYDFQKDNKRMPNLEEKQKIGARLLQEHAVGLISRQLQEGGWGREKTFHIPVPEADAERIKADPGWSQLGIVPTDAQVQRVYSRSLYNKFYGPKKTLEAGQ